jgi:hypothetical protein
MTRRPSRRINPQLEALEDRCTPSTLTNFLHASGLSGLLPHGSNGTVPFSAFSQNLPTQTVPFELAGSGTAPQGLPLFPGGMASHTSSGLSNLLGSYNGNGSFTLLSFTSATTGTFQGTFDFVAGNGDQLACNYGAGSPGTFTITPAANGNVIVQFLAVFTPIPSECTGRFAAVTGGGFTMVAVSQPFDPTPNAQGYTMPFQYSWEGQGMLVEQAGNGAQKAHVPFVPLPLTYAAPSVVAPFETAGAGHGPQGLPLFAGGMASHDATGGINLLGTYHGKYSGTGEFTLLNFTGPATGNFQGTFDFVARNGDQLPCTYGAGSPGTFTIFPAANGKVVVQFVAVFAPVTSECTGRFAGITGGNWMMIATTDPFDPTPNAQGYTGPLTYSWVGAGLFLENKTSARHIIGLFEFGELASALAAMADQEYAQAHSWPALGSLPTGEERSASVAAAIDQPAIPGLFFSSLNSPQGGAELFGSKFYPFLASGRNLLDLNGLFSSQIGAPFGMGS